MKIIIILLTVIIVFGGLISFLFLQTFKEPSQESKFSLKDSSKSNTINEIPKNKKSFEITNDENEKNITKNEEPDLKNYTSPAFENEQKNQPIADKTDLVVTQNSHEKELPEIILNDIYTPKKEIIEEDSKKTIKFIDELGNPIFGDRVFEVKTLNERIDERTSIVINKSQNQMWEIEVNSSAYYLKNLQNKFLTGNKFIKEKNGATELSTIVLSQYSIIEIEVSTKNGGTLIPNFTKCTLKQNWFTYVDGEIVNGKAIFKTKINGVFYATEFSANNFFKYFSKEITLVPGKTTSFALELDTGNPQGFKVLDDSFKPLENYYVIFTKNEIGPFNLKSYRNQFAAKGKFSLANNIGISNAEGFGEAKMISNGDYYCYVFGKDHADQMFIVKVDELRPTVEFNMSNKKNVSLVLITKKDGEDYLEDVDFTYYDLNEYGAMHSKTKGKIVAGKLLVQQLKQSKYLFELNDSKFKREKITIDFSIEKDITQIINLEESNIYIKGKLQDKAGNAISRARIDLSDSKNRFSTKVDLNGNFFIGGLEADKGYHLWVSSDYPQPKNLPKLIYPSEEELIVTLEDKIYLTGTVLDLDGKPATNYTIKYEQSDKKDFRHGSTSFGYALQNGHFKIDTRKYGYFRFTITIPNKPVITKVVPIQKEEDNVPLTFQMEPGLTIKAYVNDCNGKTVANASLTRFEYKGCLVDGVMNEIVKTDENGFFQLDNCAKNEVYYIVKVGYVPIKLNINDDTTAAVLNLSFPKSYKLKGSLKMTDGKPHSSVQVVGCLKNNRSYLVVTNTKEDGTFSVNTIIPGEWYFYFNVVKAKNQKKPGKFITIVDKDEEMHLIHDLPHE